MLTISTKPSWRLIQGVLWFAVISLPTTSHCASWGAVVKTQGHGDPDAGPTYEYAWPTLQDFSLPCKASKCWLGVAAHSSGRGGEVHPAHAGGVISYRDGERVSDVRDRWVQKFGTSGQLDNPKWMFQQYADQSAWDSLCVGFQYWPSGDGKGTLLPDTTCGRVQPRQKTCGAVRELSFDFGALPSWSVVGAQSSLDARLSCEGVQSVSLRLLKKIKLSPDLSAVIDADNMRLGPNGLVFTVSGTGRDFTFTSTLVGQVGSASGRYSASSVLMVEIL